MARSTSAVDLDDKYDSTHAQEATFRGGYDEIPTPPWSAPSVVDGFALRLHRAHALALLIPAVPAAQEYDGVDTAEMLMDLLCEEIRGLRALANRATEIFQEKGVVAR